MRNDDEIPDAWSQLKIIGEAERHFNEIESKYRALASTWLLAAFGGMGFVIESPDILFQKGIIILVIAIAASIGIQLIWIIDLLAYHRLLQSYFIEGLKIESENPDFPQARWNMLKLTKLGEEDDESKEELGSVEGKVKWFYAGCSIAPIPFGVIALVIDMDYSTVISPSFVVLLVGIIPLVSTYYLWYETTTPKMTKEIEKLQQDSILYRDS